MRELEAEQQMQTLRADNELSVFQNPKEKAGRLEDGEQSMKLSRGETGLAPSARGRNCSFRTMEQFKAGSNMH